MSSNRAAIIALYQVGTWQIEIAQTLRISRQLVSKSITRFNEFGHEGDHPGRGTKKQQLLLGPVKGSKSAFSETRAFH